MVGIICTPGLNRIEVAAKTWWGSVPMSPYPQARLPIYRRCSERKRVFSIKSFTNTFSCFRTNFKKIMELSLIRQVIKTMCEKNGSWIN